MYSQSNVLPKPKEPLKIAIIGGGNRTWTVYRLLLPSLAPWVTVTAVCDPVKEHADRLGNALNVPVFYHIRDLVASRPMEAVLILTPIESHYAYSMFCSAHGIHHMVETMFCNLTTQAKQMLDTAKSNQVILRMAENFFRFPVDRFAKAVKDSQSIGKIGRIVCYSDFMGYHNNSRWLWFAGAHPLWAQSVEHELVTPPHRSFAHRLHTKENFSARFFAFPDGFFVSDQAANIKGLLGRHLRPGYTEWQGERGTLVQQGKWPQKGVGFNPLYPFANLEAHLESLLGRIELRRCAAILDHPDGEIEGVAQEYAAVDCEYQHKIWSHVSAKTEDGLLEYHNSMLPVIDANETLPADGVSVMEVVADFALAARGLRDGEFNAEDAAMSVYMEMAARESALNEGKRIALPLSDSELEADALEAKRVSKKLNIDLHDVDAMLDIHYPRP